MPKITFKVHDETCRRARVWAAWHDTSVSEIVKYLLETLPSIKRAARAFPALNRKSAPACDKSASN